MSCWWTYQTILDPLNPINHVQPDTDNKLPFFISTSYHLLLKYHSTVSHKAEGIRWQHRMQVSQNGKIRREVQGCHCSFPGPQCSNELCLHQNSSKAFLYRGERRCLIGKQVAVKGGDQSLTVLLNLKNFICRQSYMTPNTSDMKSLFTSTLTSLSP